jgi:hypothetical protein
MYIATHEGIRYGQGQDVPCGENAGLEGACYMTGCGTQTLSGKTWFAVRKDPMKMIGAWMDLTTGAGPAVGTSTSGDWCDCEDNNAEGVAMTGARDRTYDGTQAMIGAPHSSNTWAARKETRVHSKTDQMKARAYLTPRADLEAGLGRFHLGSPTNLRRRTVRREEPE